MSPAHGRLFGAHFGIFVHSSTGSDTKHLSDHYYRQQQHARLHHPLHQLGSRLVSISACILTPLRKPNIADQARAEAISARSAPDSLARMPKQGHDRAVPEPARNPLCRAWGALVGLETARAPCGYLNLAAGPCRTLYCG